MSFPDRFELLDLMQEGDVQTFRARERGTDRAVVVHFASSAEKLSSLSPVVDRGGHEGKFYVVTAASLDSAGAWRIAPSTQSTAPSAPAAPAPSASPEPGEFTRMFQLHQAPEPVAMPASKPADRSPAAAEPGQFTRAFQRPASAPSSALASPPAAGPGEFTRMFQTPAAAPARSVPATIEPVPAVPEPAVQPVEAGSPAAARGSGRLIVAIIAILFAIAVFVLWRKLY